MYNESIVNTKPIKRDVDVIGLKLKNALWNIAQYKKPKIIRIKRDVRIILKGLQILYRWMNPVIAVKKTHKDVSNPSFKWKTWANIVTKTILKTTVNAVGKLFETIFNKKFPFTSSVFGSRARINEGMPIVNPVIRVNWIGIKKYFVERIMLNRINKTV